MKNYLVGFLRLFACFFIIIFLGFMLISFLMCLFPDFNSYINLCTKYKCIDLNILSTNGLFIKVVKRHNYEILIDEKKYDLKKECYNTLDNNKYSKLIKYVIYLKYQKGEKNGYDRDFPSIDFYYIKFRDSIIKNKKRITMIQTDPGGEEYIFSDETEVHNDVTKKYLLETVDIKNYFNNKKINKYFIKLEKLAYKKETYISTLKLALLRRNSNDIDRLICLFESELKDYFNLINYEVKYDFPMNMSSLLGIDAAVNISYTRIFELLKCISILNNPYIKSKLSIIYNNYQYKLNSEQNSLIKIEFEKAMTKNPI